MCRYVARTAVNTPERGVKVIRKLVAGKQQKQQKQRYVLNPPKATPLSGTIR